MSYYYLQKKKERDEGSREERTNLVIPRILHLPLPSIISLWSTLRALMYICLAPRAAQAAFGERTASTASAKRRRYVHAEPKASLSVRNSDGYRE
jgi:hypothetical protein